MKKFKKITSVVLTSAMLLSMAACNGGSGNTGDNASGNAGGGDTTTTSVTTSAITTVTFEENEDVLGAVQNAGDKYKDESLDPSTFKKISFLSNWERYETEPSVELFKSLYGIPEEGDEEKYGDKKDYVFDCDLTAYADLYTKLATRMSAGDAPDLFPYAINNYPFALYKGMFQPIDGLVDITTEEWADAKETYEQFRWGDSNYLIYVDRWSTQSVWVYRKTIAEEAGLDDPRELYEAGEWDWDKMLELAEQFQQTGTADNPKYFCDGWQIHYSLLSTTGTPLISLKDGGIVSNLNNPNVERASALLVKMRENNYTNPRHIDNGGSPDFNKFASGNILFHVTGIWFYQDNNFNRYTKKYEWDDLEIVPAPKDPKADKYYQDMACSGYFLCSGSDNLDCVKAYWLCERASNMDPEIMEAGKLQNIANYECYTEELHESVQEYLHGDTLVPVYDFKNGIGQDIAYDQIAENCVDMLLVGDFLYGVNDVYDTYTVMREKNEGQINARLEELNASVGR